MEYEYIHVGVCACVCNLDVSIQDQLLSILSFQTKSLIKHGAHRLGQASWPEF